MPVTLVPVLSSGSIVSFKLQTPEEDKEVKAKQQRDGERERQETMKPIHFHLL